MPKLKGIRKIISFLKRIREYLEQLEENLYFKRVYRKFINEYDDEEEGEELFYNWQYNKILEKFHSSGWKYAEVTQRQCGKIIIYDIVERDRIPRNRTKDYIF